MVERITDDMVEAALNEAGSAWGMHLTREAKARLMRAALSAALQHQASLPVEWQPINTAPTNRAILIHVPHLDYYGNDGVYAAMLVDRGTGKRWMTFGWAIGRDLGAENAPVSWREMPLAAAPSTGGR